MTQAIRTHTSNGTKVLYDVDFDLGYLDRTHVFVYLDSDEPTTQLVYTWINDTQIQLQTAPLNGVVFNIRRITPTILVNDFSNGAILREEELDRSFTQSLMVAEETEDNLTLGVVSQQDVIDLVEAELAGIGDFIGVLPLTTPRVTGNGIATTFVTGSPVQYAASSYLVHLDGVRQRDTTDYTVNTSGEIVFVDAPEVDVVVDIILYQPVTIEGADVITLPITYLNSLRATGLPTFADNTAAAALATGQFYATATGELRIKV